MEEERQWTLYCLTDRIYGKKYFGITSRKPEVRWAGGRGYKKGQRLIYNAIQMFGWENFDKEIIETNMDYQRACMAEQEYIEKYNSRTPNGYNLESGGFTGKRHAEESKKLISQKTTERFSKPEWKEKLRTQNSGERNPMFGKHVSEANKQKLREVHLGKRKSDETRYKMSLHHADFSGANHYNAKSVKQYTWDCKFVAEYDCIKNAEKAVPHCDIYACVSGKTKQAGGYLWRSAEDEPPKEHYQKEEYKNGRTDCQNNGRKAKTSDF